MNENGENVEPRVVAVEVAEACNNPAMAGWLRLHLEAVERHGFRIIRADTGRTVESP